MLATDREAEITGWQREDRAGDVGCVRFRLGTAGRVLFLKKEVLNVRVAKAAVTTHTE